MIEITANDVGRVALTRDGRRAFVNGFDLDESIAAYCIEGSGKFEFCNSSGNCRRSSENTNDLIAWADEPQGWRDLSTLPEKDKLRASKTFLLTDGNWVGEGLWRKTLETTYGQRGDEGWYSIDDDQLTSKPMAGIIAWQPLPAPPEGK